MAETVEAQRPREQKVRIVAGPFKQFVGALEDDDPDYRKVMVSLSLFGRPIHVVLDRDQVVRI